MTCLTFWDIVLLRQPDYIQGHQIHKKDTILKGSNSANKGSIFLRWINVCLSALKWLRLRIRAHRDGGNKLLSIHAQEKGTNDGENYNKPL